jgi:glyoxylase-like metal-dependent hydrolase (beta-lactamase superfamily II)
LFSNARLYSWDSSFKYAEASRFAPDFERPNIPHHTMSDGETVEIYGRSVQGIYTPGHKSDSLSFLIDGRYLFVGDLLVTLNNAQDRELQTQSRKSVLSIDSVEYVFNGHFGFFKDVRLFRWWFI